MRAAAFLYAVSLAACSAVGGPSLETPSAPAAFFASGAFIPNGAAIFFDEARGGPALFSNGVSASRTGRELAFGDGTSLRRHGSVVFLGDGGTAAIIGDTVLFSDGRACRRVGRALSCL